MSLSHFCLYPQHILLTCKSKAQWTDLNPVLLDGELVIEADTLRLKLGDGVSSYTSLPYTDSAMLDKIEALESQTAQFESLAEALLLYFNSLIQKLEREECDQQ